MLFHVEYTVSCNTSIVQSPLVQHNPPYSFPYFVCVWVWGGGRAGEVAGLKIYLKLLIICMLST